MRVLLSVLLLASVPLSAQTLEQRVNAVGTGTVRFAYPAKEGVCGDGRGGYQIVDRDGRRTMHNVSVNSSRNANEWEFECEPGPVRVAIDVRSREVVAVRAYVGGRWLGDAERDLGDVTGAEASAFFMRIAESGNERAAKDAIFPALLADAPSPSAQLLAIAKDTRRPSEVRTTATFWVAQTASAVVTAGLQELTNDPDRTVRDGAVFALSQRPNDESVPALIRLARTHRDPAVRRSAVFWLGQKRDPRALEYFEQVLLPR